MNVLKAVRLILSGVPPCSSGIPGSAQAVVPNRRMMYAPISPVKNMTSEARKTHIPSFWL